MSNNPKQDKVKADLNPLAMSSSNLLAVALDVAKQSCRNELVRRGVDREGNIVSCADAMKSWRTEGSVVARKVDDEEKK